MSELDVNEEILQEDLKLLTQCDLPWDKLHNVTVLITGATGLIGGTLVKALAYSNSIGLTSARIIGVVRNRIKAEKIFGELLHQSDIQLICQNVLKPIEYSNKIDYLVHGASVTSSKSFVTTPIETILTAVNGTENLLELAVEKQVKGFVYLSSMEVYGIPDKSKAQITEKDYGLIDPLDVRSSYSEGKRMVECLCKAYQVQKNVPVKIARLVQTFGPGVDKSENRVFAQFARSVINGEDIILHTQGDTKHPYLYTSDAVSAIIMLMLKGTNGEVYNVANPDTYFSIYEMAKLVAGLDNTGRVKVRRIVEDINKYGYAPTMKLNLSVKKIEALGWKAQVGLKEAYQRMIKSMINQNKLDCTQSAGE